MTSKPKSQPDWSPNQGFTCGCCGEHHAELPLAYGTHAPALYYQIAEAERKSRCELMSDLCVIDEEYFFIVGNLEIPIQGIDRLFSWDVWVSLSRENFSRTCKLWESPGRECEPPYFGWLNTALRGYPDTLSIKTHVHTRAIGFRPYIELEPTDHPLAVEQRNGITMERLQKIAEMVFHQDD